MLFTIIGISDDRQLFFPPDVLEVIARGRVFTGGVRHREIVAGLLPEGADWIDITVPIDDVFVRYEGKDDIVAFASGDPLFFGFANTVRRKCPDAKIVLYPSFNSLQMLAHRLVMPYHDMRCVSLTGRPWGGLDEAVINGERLIGVLTDKTKTPSAIARRLLDYGYDNYRVVVGENLGNRKKEQVSVMSISEAAEMAFSMPNCVLLERVSVRNRPFGISESEFELLNGRVKMITKMPVRLLSLSMLGLRERSSMWDVGFCTGSVSIEAKLQFPHLDITAFEQRHECEALMATNSRRFGAPGITTVIGDFLEQDLSECPRPDAVFIGGHGGRLVQMLGKIREVMLPGGTVVFNSVSEESCRMFAEAVGRVGMQIVQTTSITIDAYNTITIMKAE